MIRDNFDIKPELVFGPVSLSADNTPAAIDCIDCNSVELFIGVGIGGITFSGSNKVEFKLTHSDDNSTYSAVGATDVILGTNADASVGTGGIVKSLIAAHAAASLTRVSYVGGKRYLKVLADFDGTHNTATPLTVAVIKSRLTLTGTTQS